MLTYLKKCLTFEKFNFAMHFLTLNYVTPPSYKPDIQTSYFKNLIVLKNFIIVCASALHVFLHLKMN